MAEPRQFAVIFAGVTGGNGQATDTIATVIAAAATPVINTNTWAATGDAMNVALTPAGGILTANHTNGARNYQVTFMGRIAKLAGVGGDVTAHVYVNGAPMAAPLSRCVFLDPTDPGSTFHMAGTVALVLGDEVAIYVENVDDTDNVQLIEGATFAIKS